MRSIYKKLLIYFLSLIFLFSMGYTHSYTQISIDYQSQVATGSSSILPIGYGYQDLTVYSAYGFVWVFYSDGNNAVYRTKQAEEGGSWSESYTVFNEGQGSGFNVTFDGQYFHFIHELNGNLNYKRGRALSNGSIDFDPEVTAYSNTQWSASSRHFSIEIDYRGKPWIIAQVDDGTNFKPVLFSSIATDGSWENRPGFPKDLAAATSSGSGAHGRALSIREIDNGVILTVWRARVPEINVSAKAWTADPGDPDGEGTLGDLENTLLTSPHSARNSIVVPQDGIALVNNETQVSRRNTNGSWELVSPGGMVASDNNSLSTHSGNIRLWDLNNGAIRYKETSDNGETWSALITKWNDPDIKQFNASQAKGSHGDHHSVLWVTGTGETLDPPFDVYMGIEGTIPEPEAPMLLTPLNGASDLTEDVTHTWEPTDIAYTYDLQVSTESDFSSFIINASEIIDTTYDISGLNLNLQYYWRVRSVSFGGTASEWSETWSYQTVGIPPAPALVSPEDGAENQPTAITFDWEEAAGAETYQLQVATFSDFTATFYDNDTITETERYVDGFDNDRVYYWRVRAINEFGEGDWSSVWSFETAIGLPAALVLVTPENNATNLPITMTFEWEEADLAETYTLQVSKVSDFSSTEVHATALTDTTYEVSNLDYSQQYFWRVRATNLSGTSGWSPVWNFTTIIERPEAPVLVTPADGANEVSTKPEFEWEEADRAETYRLQVATAAEFDSIVVDVEDIDNTAYSLTEELDAFTTYYWRVNAINVGGTSDWSDGWEFETGQAFPTAPVLDSPADGSTDIDTEILVLWNSVPTATQYHLQVADNSDFDSPVVENDEITNTFYTVSDLEGSTQYYWRVRAISDAGAGDWSATWSFTTKEVTSVRDVTGGIPDEFHLQQNYPNPFNPTTTIRFGIPEASTVTLEVYNMIGQRVATLIDGEFFSAGTYEAVWDARDEIGREVSSGIYIYRISANDYMNIKQMLLIK